MGYEKFIKLPFICQVNIDEILMNRAIPRLQGRDQSFRIRMDSPEKPSTCLRENRFGEGKAAPLSNGLEAFDTLKTDCLSTTARGSSCPDG
jgi:hypothetical protein